MFSLSKADQYSFLHQVVWTKKTFQASQLILLMPNFVHELTTARPGAMEEPGRGWRSLSPHFPQTLLPKGNGKLRFLLRISFQLVELEEDKVAGSLGKQSMCRVYNQPWRTGSCERHMDGTGRCRGDGTLRLLLPVTPRNSLPLQISDQ